MHNLAVVLTLIVALLHTWFWILEMFLWDKPLGMKTFHNSKAEAAASKVLAANQGLYNSFLAAGLFYGLLGQPGGMAIIWFCLICVVVAGAYGAVSFSMRIFFIQALPAILALFAWAAVSVA